MSASRARQLIGYPTGDSLIEYRDRAILKFYIYSGARLATGCRLKVSDFHHEDDATTIRLHEKGDKRRTIGLHYAAAQALGEYVEAAGIASGPLFRPRLNPRSKRLANRSMDPATMYRLIESYLEKLPGAMRELVHPDGSITQSCIYTPHSLRATAATLLLDASIDIRKVQDLLGHRHVTTTQIYDKRRRTTAESALARYAYLKPEYDLLLIINVMFNCKLSKRCEAEISGPAERDAGDWIVRCWICGAKNVLVATLQITGWRQR